MEKIKDDREVGWPKGLLSPPATPSVHVRPTPSVVSLLCIKVRGKDTIG